MNSFTASLLPSTTILATSSSGMAAGGPQRGANLKHALAALQAENGLRVTGQANCDTWHTLGGGTSGSVSREESAVRLTHADGRLILFAPATAGSEHDPLPIGDWKVTDWDAARIASLVKPGTPVLFR